MVMDRLQVKNVVSLRDVQRDDYYERIDDSFMWAVILNIHHSRDNARYNTWSSRGSSLGGVMSRFKAPTEVAFDRMIMFGDLRSKTGECFVMLFESNHRAGYIMGGLLGGLMGGQASIGDCVAIEEAFPDAHGQCLSKNGELPIISTSRPLVKLSRPVVEVPLSVPDESITRWFKIDNCNLQAYAVIMQESVCGGILCDRQLRVTGKTVCVCFNTDRR